MLQFDVGSNDMNTFNAGKMLMHASNHRCSQGALYCCLKCWRPF